MGEDNFLGNQSSCCKERSHCTICTHLLRSWELYWAGQPILDHKGTRQFHCVALPDNHDTLQTQKQSLKAVFAMKYWTTTQHSSLSTWNNNMGIQFLSEKNTGRQQTWVQRCLTSLSAQHEHIAEQQHSADNSSSHDEYRNLLDNAC